MQKPLMDYPRDTYKEYDVEVVMNATGCSLIHRIKAPTKHYAEGMTKVALGDCSIIKVKEVNEHEEVIKREDAQETKE